MFVTRIWSWLTPRHLLLPPPRNAWGRVGWGCFREKARANLERAFWWKPPYRALPHALRGGGRRQRPSPLHHIIREVDLLLARDASPCELRLAAERLGRIDHQAPPMIAVGVAVE